eukprot:gene8015-8213_t
MGLDMFDLDDDLASHGMALDDLLDIETPKSRSAGGAGQAPDSSAGGSLYQQLPSSGRLASMNSCPPAVPAGLADGTFGHLLHSHGRQHPENVASPQLQFRQQMVSGWPATSPSSATAGPHSSEFQSSFCAPGVMSSAAGVLYRAGAESVMETAAGAGSCLPPGAEHPHACAATGHPAFAVVVSGYPQPGLSTVMPSSQAGRSEHEYQYQQPPQPRGSGSPFSSARNQQAHYGTMAFGSADHHSSLSGAQSVHHQELAMHPSRTASMSFRQDGSTTHLQLPHHVALNSGPVTHPGGMGRSASMPGLHPGLSGSTRSAQQQRAAGNGLANGAVVNGGHSGLELYDAYQQPGSGSSSGGSGGGVGAQRKRIGNSCNTLEALKPVKSLKVERPNTAMGIGRSFSFPISSSTSQPAAAACSAAAAVQLQRKKFAGMPNSLMRNGVMIPPPAGPEMTARGKPTFSDLVQAGAFPSGTFEFSVGTVQSIIATVANTGVITYGSDQYQSISSFALAAARSRNPSRQACDGWKEVRLQGHKLELWRQAFLKKAPPPEIPAGCIISKGQQADA